MEVTTLSVSSSNLYYVYFIISFTKEEGNTKATPAGLKVGLGFVASACQLLCCTQFN